MQPSELKKRTKSSYVMTPEHKVAILRGRQKRARRERKMAKQEHQRATVKREPAGGVSRGLQSAIKRLTVKRSKLRDQANAITASIRLLRSIR
jgi:uncharacterized protein (UPF0218 family)